MKRILITSMIILAAALSASAQTTVSDLSVSRRLMQRMSLNSFAVPFPA